MQMKVKLKVKILLRTDERHKVVMSIIVNLMLKPKPRHEAFPSSSSNSSWHSALVRVRPVILSINRFEPVDRVDFVD